MKPLATLTAIYEGSNGDATRALYQELVGIGPAGVIAMNLFRACKCSARAKVYRGGNGHGSYRSQAYERKDWSIAQLCDALRDHGAALGITWGWRDDPKKEPGDPFRTVLYIDLPTGQVSFHNPRKHGPDYPKEWDGAREQGPARICGWIATLGREPANHDGMVPNDAPATSPQEA